MGCIRRTRELTIQHRSKWKIWDEHQCQIWIDGDLQLRFSQMGCRSVLFRSMRMEENNDKVDLQETTIIAGR